MRKGIIQKAEVMIDEYDIKEKQNERKKLIPCKLLQE
jgi:hypothetical protein